MFDSVNLASITIGADPEIFVGKDGEIVSAHHLPFGTKAEPLKTDHGSIQVDGLALEVNVTPANACTRFIVNCGNVLQDLENKLKASDKEMYLVCKPTAFFTEQYLKSLPKEATELGCNPDWNAYELGENPRPDATGNFRTAGGHIHIGWGNGFNPNDQGHLGICAEIAKQLDYTIGIRSLDYDNDTTRRKLYGQAGAFRPKPYGMEYRTLSPLWLAKIHTTSMVFQGTMKALRMLKEGRVLDEEFEGAARRIINDGDKNWRYNHPTIEKAIK